MKQEILKAAGIDYERGVKRFMGRAQLYEKALSKFPRDGAFGRIREAYETNDRAQLLSSAHEFKGMCGNIGLTALYEYADALVGLLRRGDAADDEIELAYGRLQKEYQTVYDAVLAAMEA